MVSSDLLAAASLLITLVSTLYAVWYGELSGAMNAPIAPFRADRNATIGAVRSTLVTRAVPLCVASVGLGVVLFPPVASTIGDAANALSHGVGRVPSYDPVRACFVVVYLVIAFLAATTGRSALAIRRRLARLRAADEGSA